MPHRDATHETITILFLTSVPDDTRRLSIDEEQRQIERELLYHQCKDKINIIVKTAVRPEEIPKHLYDI